MFLWFCWIFLIETAFNDHHKDVMNISFGSMSRTYYDIKFDIFTIFKTYIVYYESFKSSITIMSQNSRRELSFLYKYIVLHFNLIVWFPGLYDPKSGYFFIRNGDRDFSNSLELFHPMSYIKLPGSFYYIHIGNWEVEL